MLRRGPPPLPPSHELGALHHARHGVGHQIQEDRSAAGPSRAAQTWQSLEDGVLCPRFPEGSSQGSQGGLSEQEQRVGQGAGLGSSPPECALPSGLPPLPTTTHQGRVMEIPGPLAFPTLAVHSPGYPPSSSSLLPGLSLPLLGAPRMATRRTLPAAASTASWRPTTTACALCSSTAPPTSPRW